MQAVPPRAVLPFPVLLPGFGMRRTGTSADNWIGHFVQWLEASKLLPQ